MRDVRRRPGTYLHVPHPDFVLGSPLLLSLPLRDTGNVGVGDMLRARSKSTT